MRPKRRCQTRLQIFSKVKRKGHYDVQDTNIQNQLQNQIYLIRFIHMEPLLSKKKRTRNSHFPRPAETDPYVSYIPNLKGPNLAIQFLLQLMAFMVHGILNAPSPSLFQYSTLSMFYSAVLSTQYAVLCTQLWFFVSLIFPPCEMCTHGIRNAPNFLRSIL